MNRLTRSYNTLKKFFPWLGVESENIQERNATCFLFLKNIQIALSSRSLFLGSSNFKLFLRCFDFQANILVLFVLIKCFFSYDSSLFITNFSNLSLIVLINMVLIRKKVYLKSNRSLNSPFKNI